MDVYKVSNQNKLDVINNTSFETEKEIQNLVENNFDTLFNLTFLKQKQFVNNLDLIPYVGMKKINHLLSLQVNKKKNIDIN